MINSKLGNKWNETLDALRRHNPCDTHVSIWEPIVGMRAWSVLRYFVKWNE